MMQFYFLSVLLNLLTGLVLVYGFREKPEDALSPEVKTDETDVSSLDDAEAGSDSETKAGEKGQSVAGILTTILNNKNFLFVVGVLTCITGLFELLPFVHNDVPVAGDLLPAVAGLAGGACILLEFINSSTTLVLSYPSFVETIFIKNRKYIGMFCLAIGLLHFLFPKVILL